MMDYYGGLNEKILARVPESANVILDVGCARGLLGTALLEGRPDRKVWGIERMPEIAEEAKGRLTHVLVGDVEQMDPLPLPERHFDCLIFGDTLEHLKEPEALLRRLRRHVKRDGRLIANVPNIAHWSVIVELLQGRFPYADAGLLDRTHLRFFTPESVEEILWEAGFQVIEVDPFTMPHPACEVLTRAAEALGLDRQKTLRAVSIYQQLFVARPLPDPNEDPEKRAILVGSHVGKLGPASKRCSIVVVTYNSAETIDDCAKSCLETMGREDELILVDNASADDTVARLKALGNADKCVKVIVNNTNLGYSAGANVGLLASKGEILITLNPDTVVYPGWIEAMAGRLSDPSVGAVGPVSDCVGGQQFVEFHLPPGARPTLDQIPGLLQEHHSGKSMATKLLFGFCLAFRRETMDEYGLLDEAMFLGADDLELSWRLRELSYELLIVLETFVHHGGGKSFASITTKSKADQVVRSDTALISKLTGYYGEPLPTSIRLWANQIFAAAMGRAGPG